MKHHLPSDVTLADHTSALGLIALQGPRPPEVRPADEDTDDLPYFGFRRGKVAGAEAIISRTGYTGEDGFELFVASDRLGHVWDAILEAGRSAGVLPPGLGARDATGIEAALRLYGNEMDETRNPH